MSAKATEESARKKEYILSSTKTPIFFPSDLKDAPYYMVLTPIKYTKNAALEKQTNERLKTDSNNSSAVSTATGRPLGPSARAARDQRLAREQGVNTPESASLETINRNFGDFGTLLSGANRGSTPKAPTLKVNLESGQIIALPLPAQLSDSLNISYNTTDLGVSAAGFQAGQSLGNSDLGLDDAVGVGAYAFRTMSSAITEQIGTLLNLISGAVPNPYSVLTFKNVEQRTFSFDWTFAPNSEAESRTIRDIINTIRYLALPNQTGLFLEFPHEWEIQFVGTQFLYSMSRGYITDLKVEYGSANGTAFFPIQDVTGGMDGAPSQIRFSFTFKEIFPLNKTLIKEGNVAMSPNSEFLKGASKSVFLFQRPALSEEEITQTTESEKLVNDLNKLNLFGQGGQG